MKRFLNILTTLVLVLGVGVGGYLVLHDADQTSGLSDANHLLGFSGSRPDPDDGRLPAHVDMNQARGWIPVGGQTEQTARIVILEDQPGKTIVELWLPGFHLDAVDIAGRPCSRLTLPGQMPLQVAGLPEVPLMSTCLTIPEVGQVRCKVVLESVRELKIDPVEPSLGHFKRNINPADIKPSFDRLYSEGGVWPEQTYALSKPFILRKQRGINLQLYPLRWDADKGALLVTEKLVLEITTSGQGGDNTLLAQKSAAVVSEPDYAPLYKQVFSNWSAPADVSKYNRIEIRGRMLIVSDAAFVTALEPFITWKQQLGIDVELVTVDSLGGTAAGVQQAISERFEDPQGLTWVILVGDRLQVPTNVGTYDGSDSDSRYALLAGDDLYPEIFVSRISASTVTHVETQVAKFIAYEKRPLTGDDGLWYQNAVGIASDEGTPTDAQRADLLRTDLLGYHYQTVAQIYQGEGGSTAAIANALEDGCSLVNYIGHGTGYGWSSVSFNVGDVAVLNNVNRLPWIIDVSCSNGRFSMNECFAEAWLRAGTVANPRGAVGMMSATSLAPWTPPTVMQAEVVDLLTQDRENTLGALYYSGLMKVLDVYAGLSVATEVFEQNVIFGDCSLMVRSVAPTALPVVCDEVLSSEATEVTVQVTGQTGAKVCLTAQGQSYGMGTIDESGEATITLTRSLAGVPTLVLTVSDYNAVPFQTTVDISGGVTPTLPGSSEGETEDDDPSLDPTLPAQIQLLGNYPNPFNPVTHIALDLPRQMQIQLAVYDVRGHQVCVLADGVYPAGRREFPWTGSDAAGRRVASGVYLYRVQTPDGQLQGRMLLTK